MTRELLKTRGDTLNTDQDNYRYYKNSMDLQEFLDRFYGQYISKYQAVGFTVMYDQLQQYPELLSYLKENSIKCIYLERTNRVKTVLSRLKARSTGVYHTTGEAEKYRHIDIDIDKALQELKILDETIMNLRMISEEFHALGITYEQLQKNSSDVLEKVQSYLSVPLDHNVSSQLKKTNDDDLKRAIVNYDEFSKVLHGTPYERYLI
jgi:hypothetical protein